MPVASRRRPAAHLQKEKVPAGEDGMTNRAAAVAGGGGGGGGGERRRREALGREGESNARGLARRDVGMTCSKACVLLSLFAAIFATVRFFGVALTQQQLLRGGARQGSENCLLRVISSRRPSCFEPARRVSFQKPEP